MPLFQLHLPATVFVQVEADDETAARALGTAIQQQTGWDDDHPFTERGATAALRGAEHPAQLARTATWMLEPATSTKAAFDVVATPPATLPSA